MSKVQLTPEQVAKLLAEFLEANGAIQMNDLVETESGTKYRVVVQKLTF